MAQLLGEQYFVARDRNGLPISGAMAFFFLTETSTAAPVYADADLTTPLGDEDLTSNSAGRFPPIYLDPAVTYRMRVYDGDPEDGGVEIEPSPFDPLTNIQTIVNDAVAAASGSAVGAPFPLKFYWPAPAAEAADVILAVKFAIAVNFPNNFTGSVGACTTNPSGSVVHVIKKNGSSIGTMTVSSGGAFTWATTETPNFDINDTMTITAPADPKGIVAPYGTLLGTVA